MPCLSVHNILPQSSKSDLLGSDTPSSLPTKRQTCTPINTSVKTPVSNSLRFVQKPAENHSADHSEAPSVNEKVGDMASNDQPTTVISPIDLMDDDDSMPMIIDVTENVSLTEMDGKPTSVVACRILSKLNFRFTGGKFLSFTHTSSRRHSLRNASPTIQSQQSIASIVFLCHSAGISTITTGTLSPPTVVTSCESRNGEKHLDER